jgi:hypothetical protein
MPKPHPLTKQKLRQEASINHSGRLLDLQSIPILKELDYYVINRRLDGDAPKELIKLYRYEPGGNIRRDRPKTWTPYIAKSAQKWYPHESVLEYFINRAGQVLGLPMNEVALYRINNQIRFLSKFFLSPNEILIHGAEICGDYLGDRAFAAEIANDKQEARELLTFSFVKEAMHTVFPKYATTLINDLVRVLVFDALLGNNDRHFYNWGVIRPVRKGGGPPRLAPIYDSARGMYWNHPETTVVKLTGLLEQPGWTKYDKYLNGASPRFSLESDKEVNHFDFISHLCQLESPYLSYTRELSSDEMETKVTNLLHTEFSHLFSPERIYLMAKIIHDRFLRVRSITQNP